MIFSKMKANLVQLINSLKTIFKFTNFLLIYETFNISADIKHTYFSPLQDDMMVIHINNDYSSMLESIFKTEFLATLKKRYKETVNRELSIVFSEA